MTSLLLFTTVITITLLVYLPTLAPTITWQGGGADSGELAAAVATLGIAHPPGYPTYILLGRAWSALPLGGDVAYRLNLLSATSAAFAAAFCSATIVLLGHPIAHSPTRPAPSLPRTLGALFGGVALGLAPLIWSQATMTEVYALGLAFVSLFGYLLILWQQKGSTSVLVLAALVAGLGMGVLPQLVLVVPGAFGLLLLRWRGLEIRSSLRQLGLALLAFAIGASTFLYLPLRATMQPTANWGDPVTFERFWQLVTAQQYHHLAQGVAVEGWLARLGTGMVQVGEQLGYLGLLPTLAGASLLWHKNRGALGYLLSLISLTLLFRTSYPAEGNLVYLMPALYAMALLMGVGLASALTIVQNRHGNRALALLTLLLVSLFSWRTITLAPQQDLSHDYSATLFAEELLSTLPPNAIIVSERDESTFSLWYQQALGQRQDIVVIDSRLLFYDWYQGNLRHHHPDLNPTALRPGGLTALTRPLYMLTEPVEKKWIAKHIKP